MLPVMEKWIKTGGCSIHSATAPLLTTACISVCAAFNGLFAQILIVVLPSPLTDDCTWSPVTAGAMILFQIQQVVIGQEFPN